MTFTFGDEIFINYGDNIRREWKWIFRVWILYCIKKREERRKKEKVCLNVMKRSDKKRASKYPRIWKFYFL